MYVLNEWPPEENSYILHSNKEPKGMSSTTTKARRKENSRNLFMQLANGLTRKLSAQTMYQNGGKHLILKTLQAIIASIINIKRVIMEESHFVQ